jgi:3,4-dihydroxy 2-butanone 4-phosphate synthase/GTP cyclohydrolase II
MGILTRNDVIQKVEEALEKLRRGEIIILTDHKDRENEGDLVCLAEKTTSAMVDFMTKKGRGLICTSLAPELVKKLGLRPAVRDNDSPYSTPFTESVDARETTTGISAEERALTIRKLAEPGAKGEDFTRPGHIFPLAAHPRGIWGRPGHTEGAVDLARLAGASPAAVICEILGEEGGMARGDELEKFALREGLLCLSMEELSTFLYQPLETVRMPLKQGEFLLSLFPALPGEPDPPMVLTAPYDDSEPVTVRIHSRCLTGDLFGSRRCDCGDQLEASLEIIAREGGVLIHLSQEGRGIGLTDKIRAYGLQEKGMDTLEANLALGHPADLREYRSAARILKFLGIHRLELLTNNPAKSRALEEEGFEIEKRPLLVPPGKDNYRYLFTKQHSMGHQLSLKEE